MTIFDGYTDFTREKYVKRQKSRRSLRLCSYTNLGDFARHLTFLPLFRGVLGPGAGEGWMRASSRARISVVYIGI
jgi:hypothetical protein